MWTHAKLLLSVTLTMFFYSCNDAYNKKVDNHKTVNSLRSNLIEKQIGKSNFYISLPPEYSIRQTKGPDFSVYYFTPTDTAIKANFAGGLYFGNFPHVFEPDGDSCKITITNGNVLGKTASWTVYNCNSDYTIQTIIDSKSGEEWSQKIHVFGSAKSDINMKKIFYIYTTLRQVKK